MKLSTKSRYGLRVLLQIAMDSEKSKVVSGREISRKQEISEPYLEQIMIPLKNAGIVSTVRGCRGGYRLKRPSHEISVLDVIEIFEGELVLVKCYDGDSACPRCERCPASEVWTSLSDSLREKAGSISLAGIAEKARMSKFPEFVI